MKRATLVLFLAAVLAGLIAPPAAAHTDVVSTSPASGDVLAEVPQDITLTFDEELVPETVVVSVQDGTGMVVRVAQPTVDGSTVTVVLPPGLTPPDYTVNYRVVSQDGHPVTGTFSFQAGTRPAVEESTPASTPASTDASAPASTPASTDASADASGSGLVGPGIAIAIGLAIGIAIGVAWWVRRPKAPSHD